MLSRRQSRRSFVLHVGQRRKTSRTLPEGRRIRELVAACSVVGGVFSAAADVFVEHARFPAAVCALPDLLFGGARLVAGTSSDVLGVVEAIRAREAWPA